MYVFIFLNRIQLNVINKNYKLRILKFFVDIIHGKGTMKTIKTFRLSQSL